MHHTMSVEVARGSVRYADVERDGLVDQAELDGLENLSL